jgi:hypothetical protein
MRQQLAAAFEENGALREEVLRLKSLTRDLAVELKRGREALQHAEVSKASVDAGSGSERGTSADLAAKLAAVRAEAEAALEAQKRQLLEASDRKAEEMMAAMSAGRERVVCVVL